MVVFSQGERDLAHSVYRDVTEAVASAMAMRGSAPASVFVAAYGHRFGVDLTVHATQEAALGRLASVATRECARDPELRDRVIAQFGCWTAQGLSLEMVEAIIDAWGDVSPGESLWVAECDVQVAGADSDVRPAVIPSRAPYTGSTRPPGIQRSGYEHDLDDQRLDHIGD